MKQLRKYALVLAMFAAVPMGCQSVATTSAKLRNQEQNYDLAIDLCRQALAANPADPEAYFQLAFAYSALDSVALAYDNFMKSIELDPRKERDAKNNIQHNFAKHYKLGQSAFNRQDFPAAADEFALSTEADPTQSVAYYNLGVAYAQIAEDDSSYHDRAITALDKVLELSNPSEGNYIKALQVQGPELVIAGREDEAVDRFKRLVEEDPTSFDVIADLGNQMLTAEKWRGAVVFLKLAAEAREKINAPDFTTYYNIGAALYNLRADDPGALAEAVVYYEKALALNDDEPQTVFNIAIAHFAAKDYRNAADWLEKYTTLMPSDGKGWQMLARSYSELGEKDKARDALKRFAALQENM